MIMPDFKDFPRAGRVIGIDWGARRTGVAVSDEKRDFVFTRPVIVAGRGEDMVKKIVDCINQSGVVGVVMGLPLRMDGSESDTTKTVRDVANKIAEYIDLPICLIDETLTSSAAADENGFHDKKSAKEKLDSESARVILENAIAVIKRL